MDFAHGRFDYETLATLNFLESVHRIIKVIIHLHHLHLTGKIIGNFFRSARITSIKNQVKNERDALECLKNKEKR